MYGDYVDCMYRYTTKICQILLSLHPDVTNSQVVIEHSLSYVCHTATVPSEGK